MVDNISLDKILFKMASAPVIARRYIYRERHLFWLSTPHCVCVFLILILMYQTSSTNLYAS